MCLDEVTKTFTGHYDQEVFEVWKVFNLNPEDGSLKFEFFNLHGMEIGQRFWIERDVTKGEWLQSTPATVKPNWEPDLRYTAGFHCFDSEVEALGWCSSTQILVKVKARGLLARGFQQRRRVSVFKEMFVPESSVETLTKKEK